MSSIPKSAKTTERRASRAKFEEHSKSKPEKELAPSVSNKTQSVSSKSSERKVAFVVSADAVDDAPTSKPGDASLTSPEREKGSSLPSSFKVIAGSYERLLYGLQGTVSVSSSEGPSELEWTLKPIFIFPAHVSYIKTVAASPQGGKWLVTGGQDEIIKVWDLRRRKEIGGLMQHEGFISLSQLRANEMTFFFQDPLRISPSLHARTSSLRQRMEPSASFALVTGRYFGHLRATKDASIRCPYIRPGRLR
jgi:protein MAK11